MRLRDRDHTQRAIRRGTFRSVKELVTKIDQFVENDNQNARPFAWTATADSIFAKVQRLCERISGQDTSKPMGEVVSHSAASRTKISLCPALGGICIGSELFSCSVRIRTAIQNRKNVSNRSAERPCQQRGVPLPSRFRMNQREIEPGGGF